MDISPGFDCYIRVPRSKWNLSQQFLVDHFEVVICHMLVRLAKLSEGQVIDGRLECLYHGWQFEGDGQCVKIPQVLSLSLSLSCIYAPVCMHEHEPKTFSSHV